MMRQGVVEARMEGTPLSRQRTVSGRLGEPRMQSRQALIP